MKKYVMMAALPAFMAAASCAHAEVVGNANAAHDKVAMCIGCHGIPDYHTAYPEVYHVPRIGGQNAQYLEAALKEYREGVRKFPTMRAIAASLSDQDIANLATYYSLEKPSTPDNSEK